MKANPEYIIDLVDDPSEFIILICLNMFPPSLNLKKISEFTNIPESSALRKIKELIKKGGIILDQDATMQKRGKFYKSSNKVTQILEKDEERSLNPVKEQAGDDEKRVKVLSILDVFGALANFNSSMIRVAIRYLSTKSKSFDPNMIEEGKIAFSLTMMKLSLESKEEKREFLDMYMDFQKKIKKFEKKKDMRHSANHSFFTSIHPIGEFEVNTNKNKENDGDHEEEELMKK